MFPRKFGNLHKREEPGNEVGNSETSFVFHV
jgi:hypothetical protein